LPKEDEVKDWNTKFHKWLKDWQNDNDSPVSQEDIDKLISFRSGLVIGVFSMAIFAFLCWTPTIPIAFAFVAGKVTFDLIDQGGSD
jgi:hypothetical protein